VMPLLRNDLQEDGAHRMRQIGRMREEKRGFLGPRGLAAAPQFNSPPPGTGWALNARLWLALLGKFCLETTAVMKRMSR
jgi:hypothetical protein